MTSSYKHSAMAFLCTALFMCVATCVSGVDLVITKDGKSFWANSIKKTATDMTYVDNRTGAKGSVPLSQVADVVPKMDKKQTYSKAEVAKNLATATKAARSHPRLLKQVNALKYEWESVSGSAVDIEKEIEKVMSRFGESRQGVQDYRTAKMGLEMLVYKDFSGSHAKMIEEKTEELLLLFIKIDLKDLEARATSPELTSKGLARMTAEVKSALAKELPRKLKERLLVALKSGRKIIMDKYIAAAEKAFSAEDPLGTYPRSKAILLKGKSFAGNEPERAAMDKEVSKLGEKALGIVIVAARRVFVKTKSIDAYFKSRQVLLESGEKLLKSIPETKSMIAKAVDQLDKDVRTLYASYDFSYKGFPLSPKDQQLLKQAKPMSSINDTFGRQDKEECYLIPSSAPAGLNMESSINLRLTFIFNCSQPPKRKYCVMLVAEKNGETFKSETPVSPLRPRQGHVSYMFRKRFSGLGEGVTPISKDGEDFMLYFLAYRDKPGDEWTPVSLAAKLKMSSK
jgi:hypothetical protein